MSTSISRELHHLLCEINIAFKATSGRKALNGHNLASDFADLIIKVGAMVHECRDEILRTRFKDAERYETLLQRLDAVHREVMNGLSKRGREGITGPVLTDAALFQILSIAEQVENDEVFDTTTISREDMVAETERMISEVKTWHLEDYAEKSMILQLNHISRIIQASDTYSGSELRLRVKAIIADFATEFVEMDKKHQTRLERLVRWGKICCFSGTALIGLTADTSSVVALLSAPQKLLPGS